MSNIFADILTIGDEILYGQITDTNSQWISAQLDKIGVRVRRKISVGDNKNEILQVIEESESKVEIIIITGGLGPTNDDITKSTLCEYFNTKLVLNPQALNAVTSFFSKRNRELTEINRQQAYLPENCRYIPNNNGTAPGMLFERNGKIIISLPGVPFEMKAIVLEEVVPEILKRYKTPVIHHKIVKTIGIGESFLAEKIKDWESELPVHIKLAYLPSFNEVKLRLTASRLSKETLSSQIDIEIEKLKNIIPEYIFGYDDDLLEKTVGGLLLNRKLSLAVAESCTGGYLSHLITSVPGSSQYFLGGIIAYDNVVKEQQLGVNSETLLNFGAVSEETVKEMAENARKKFSSDIGLSTSGIAGPSGGTEQKPVGTVWIACSYGDKTITRKLVYGKLRDVNIRLASIASLNLVRQMLLNLV